MSLEWLFQSLRILPLQSRSRILSKCIQTRYMHINMQQANFLVPWISLVSEPISLNSFWSQYSIPTINNLWMVIIYFLCGMKKCDLGNTVCDKIMNLKELWIWKPYSTHSAVKKINKTEAFYKTIYFQGLISKKQKEKQLLTQLKEVLYCQINLLNDHSLFSTLPLFLPQINLHRGPEKFT